MYGIGSGLWVFWSAGALLMAWPGRLRESLVYGCLFFTVTQGILCFHFAAGLVSVFLFDPCVKYLPESAAPFLRGFVYTVMTGQLCILMALPIGYVVTVPAKQPVPPPTPTSDDEDEHE